MHIFDHLLAMPDELKNLFDDFPSLLFHQEPESWDGIPGERFAITGQLCHLLDIEIQGYQHRFHRTVNETMPELPSLDGYLLAELNQYKQADPKQVLMQFRLARLQTVKMLKALKTEDYSRRANFGSYGEVSLLGLAHLLRSHDLQHLACMHWLRMRLLYSTEL
ncbi:DinB family protein (plasmid) [Deefgea piscis]|uniref:DinB family protein n=1 Tax=Deefgea piscis TaxID=2739061 RepID=A0A6M8SSI4_9NEIS|nr:DinB family protein [Deefgea piscis]QKJ68283.1 DinB family protein [Deefgea piscis]